MKLAKICAAGASILALHSVAFANDPSQPAALFDPFEGEWVLHTYFIQADEERFEQDAELIVRRMETYQAPVFMFEERHKSFDDSGMFIGRVMYAYHEETGLWRGIGVNTLANRKWRNVSVVDGDIFIVESGELFGGRPGKNRFTYFNISECSFELRAEYSPDGETWRPGRYGLSAEKADCTPATGDR